MLLLPVATAFAEGTAPAGVPGVSGLMSIAPLIVLFVIFYFLLIRPQQKRAKEQKAMISALQKGDTSHQRRHARPHSSVNEDTVMVEISDGVR